MASVGASMMRKRHFCCETNAGGLGRLDRALDGREPLSFGVAAPESGVSRAGISPHKITADYPLRSLIIPTSTRERYRTEFLEEFRCFPRLSSMQREAASVRWLLWTARKVSGNAAH